LSNKNKNTTVTKTKVFLATKQGLYQTSRRSPGMPRIRDVGPTVLSDVSLSGDTHDLGVVRLRQPATYHGRNLGRWTTGHYMLPDIPYPSDMWATPGTGVHALFN